jgi:beta-lactamase class A
VRKFFLASAFLVAATAFADFREFTNVPVDPAIATKLRMAAQATLKQFPQLKDEDLAISAIDLTNPNTVARADYHGDAPFYPASVIKLFFMADTFATHKEGVPDVDRALKEMIAVSDNDATAYIVDVISGATGGPSLQGRALRRFVEQRREINKRFARLGYQDNLSAMMKAWSFGPFGRELQLLGSNKENRNKATANAVASLLLWIARRRATGSEAMLNLLARPLSPARENENQVKEFIGETLPADAKLWSKAGWTSEVRHDAAYIEFAGGRKIILVIFTRGTGTELTIVPAVARNVLAEWQ